MKINERGHSNIKPSETTISPVPHALLEDPNLSADAKILIILAVCWHHYFEVKEYKKHGRLNDDMFRRVVAELKSCGYKIQDNLNDDDYFMLSDSINFRDWISEK